MSKRKILVTGGSGLVGSYLLPHLNGKYDLYVTTNKTPTICGKNIPLDLLQIQNVSVKIREIKPDVIINLAAFTDVDGCEINHDLSMQLNRDLVATLSKYVHDNSSYLLHISTDYVFDGNKGNYDEFDDVNPINWYGLTKLQGEKEIISKLRKDSWCIARISTPFGIHKQKLSFPSFVIEKLYKGESIRVLTDQFTSPTYTVNLASMLEEIIERRISGLIHASGASRLSRYEQALKICSIFGLNENLILKIRSNEMNWKAKRPKDSSLNVNKASNVLYNKPETFDQALKQFANEINHLNDADRLR